MIGRSVGRSVDTSTYKVKILYGGLLSEWMIIILREFLSMISFGSANIDLFYILRSCLCFGF